MEDFVNLHDSKLATFLAVLCKYLVIDAYCVGCKGVLATGYAKVQLMTVTRYVTISGELENCSQNITLRGGR